MNSLFGLLGWGAKREGLRAVRVQVGQDSHDQGASGRLHPSREWRSLRGGGGFHCWEDRCPKSIWKACIHDHKRWFWDYSGSIFQMNWLLLPVKCRGCKSYTNYRKYSIAKFDKLPLWSIFFHSNNKYIFCPNLCLNLAYMDANMILICLHSNNSFLYMNPWT